MVGRQKSHWPNLIYLVKDGWDTRSLALILLEMESLVRKTISTTCKLSDVQASTASLLYHDFLCLTREGWMSSSVDIGLSAGNTLRNVAPTNWMLQIRPPAQQTQRRRLM